MFPIVQREIRRLRRCARDIPDPVLRSLALDAQQRKWASLEGAAAFAAFAPRGQRARVTRLLVDLQGVFDYADTLMEQPNKQPAENARQLHRACIEALQPAQPHHDYYEHHARHEDGGYLAGLTDACRACIRQLPSYAGVAQIVVGHAQRVVFYQSDINLAVAADYDDLARWASKQVAGGELKWWELGAACGSSLAIFAQLAAAADRTLTSSEVDAIDSLYWPWAEALHILLDSLVDRAEDRATGQPNLLDHYSSQDEMTERLALLANETAERAREVAPQHRLILAGMVALYLSDEQAWTAFARPATERILQATGALAKPALLMLRARRLAPKTRRRSLESPSGG